MGCSNGVCLWSFGKCPAGAAPAQKVAVGGTFQTAWLSFLRTHQTGEAFSCSCLSRLYRCARARLQPVAYSKLAPNVQRAAVCLEALLDYLQQGPGHSNAIGQQHSKKDTSTPLQETPERCPCKAQAAESDVCLPNAGPVAALAWHPHGHLLAAAVHHRPGFTVFDVSTGLSTAVAAGTLPCSSTAWLCTVLRTDTAVSEAFADICHAACQSLSPLGLSTCRQIAR